MPEYGPGTALIVVDVQNDFADPKGSLYVKDGEAVVPVANREVERAREAGSPVFYTQDWHPESTPHFAKDGGVWPVHCVGGTCGAELHPDLTVAGEVIRKGTGGEDGYSGFTVKDPQSGDEAATALGARLRELLSHGGRPFEPMPGRAMKGYAYVPDGWLSDPQGAARLVAEALAHVGAMPPKK